jgi:hypothetical protein
MTANIGAQALSNCYRELEACARHSRMDQAGARLAQARREHDRAVGQLKRLLQEMA